MSGRESCYHHGGKTPRGVTSPQFRHGRYSRSLPSRYLETYEEAFAEAKKLELTAELTGLIQFNQEIYEALDTGESGKLWKKLRTEVEKYRQAQENVQIARSRFDDEMRMRYQQQEAEALTRLLKLIDRGASEAEHRDELRRGFHDVRQFAESERKRLLDAHQMATTEELMAFMGAVLGILKKHVHDQGVLRAIGYDIDALISQN